MDTNNSFDIKLESYKGKASDEMVEAATYVTDTLDLAWAAAQAVFNDQAKPEHALRLVELFFSEAKALELERLEDYRRRLEHNNHNQ